MRVQWKKFINTSIQGKSFQHDAEIFNDDLTLLDRIEGMPEGIPITVHAGYDTYWNELMDHLVGEGGGGCPAAGSLLNQDWITWLSSQGFKIILKGDEYSLTQLN